MELNTGPTSLQGITDMDGPMSEEHNLRFNRYTCDTCGHAFHTAQIGDQLATPFALKCRSEQGCKGSMTSAFYACDQNVAPQDVTCVWVPDPRPDEYCAALVVLSAASSSLKDLERVICDLADTVRDTAQRATARFIHAVTLKPPAVPWGARVKPAGSAHNRIRANPRISRMMKPKRTGG